MTELALFSYSFYNLRGAVMIQTNRLQLISPCLDHAGDLFEVWSDFEVIKYTYMPLLKTYEECEDKLKMFIERNSEHGSILNFIILYHGKAIGICGFPLIDAERGEYGFYYQLCRKHWSQGLGYEAAKGLLNYIVDNTQAQAVFADAVSINPASLSILSRIGFQKNHIQPGGFNRNNLVLELVHFKYEIIRAFA